MKQLISLKDIENAKQLGQDTIILEENAIVTLAAKDAARASGITFSTEASKVSAIKLSDVIPKACDDEIDANMIYKVLKLLADKGLLQGVMDSIVGGKPYMAECDACGLKIVRGKTVRYEALSTGNPNDKVFYQEIMNKQDGCSMNAGFITIEDCQFDWECACEEVYHIVEGTLTVNVNSKSYTAQQGDAVFFPKGAKVVLGSPDNMKAFYATY